MDTTELIHLSKSLLYCGSKSGCIFELTSAERRPVTSLNLLSPCSCSPGCWWPLLLPGCSAYMNRYLPTHLHNVFSAELLPSLNGCKVLFLSRRWTLHVFLLSFITFLLIQFSMWWQPSPQAYSLFYPELVSSADLINKHSSKSLMKILNMTGPRRDPMVLHLLPATK